MKIIFFPAKYQILSNVFIALTALLSCSHLGWSMENEENNLQLLESEKQIIAQTHLAYCESELKDTFKSLQAEYSILKADFDSNKAQGILSKAIALNNQIEILTQEILFDTQRWESTGRSNKNLEKKLAEKESRLDSLCTLRDRLICENQVRLLLEQRITQLKKIARSLTESSEKLCVIGIDTRDLVRNCRELVTEIDQLQSFFPLPEAAVPLPSETLMEIMNNLNLLDYHAAACVSTEWDEVAEKLKGSFSELSLTLIYNFIDKKAFKNCHLVSKRWKDAAQIIKDQLPQSPSDLIERLKKQNFENQLSLLTDCCQYGDSSAKLFFSAYQTYYDIDLDFQLFYPTEENQFEPSSKTNDCLLSLQNLLTQTPHKTINALEHEELESLITIYRPYELCLMASAFLGYPEAVATCKYIYDLYLYEVGAAEERKELVNFSLMRELLLRKKEHGVRAFSFLNCPNTSVLDNLCQSKAFLNGVRYMAVLNNNYWNDNLNCLFSSGCYAVVILNYLFYIEGEIIDLNPVLNIVGAKTKAWLKTLETHEEFLMRNSHLLDEEKTNSTLGNLCSHIQVQRRGLVEEILTAANFVNNSDIDGLLEEAENQCAKMTNIFKYYENLLTTFKENEETHLLVLAFIQKKYEEHNSKCNKEK